MGCCCKCHKSIFSSYLKRRNKEADKFIVMKTGLNKSLMELNNNIENINDWESLFGNEEQEKEDIISDNNISKKQKCFHDCFKLMESNCEKYKDSVCCFILYPILKIITPFICGFIFCIIHLIGIQEGIIILNALYNEIIEEIKFRTRNKPRENNFFEHIEIASYKSIPEIDVGMFFSFLGIFILKKSGLLICYLFQIFSLAYLILLFLLFDFHTEDKLLIYYSNLELAILIYSYFFLSLTIGSFSTMSIKTFFNIYEGFYKKYLNLEEIFCNSKTCAIWRMSMNKSFMVLFPCIKNGEDKDIKKKDNDYIKSNEQKENNLSNNSRIIYMNSDENLKKNKSYDDGMNINQDIAYINLYQQNENKLELNCINTEEKEINNEILYNKNENQKKKHLKEIKKDKEKSDEDKNINEKAKLEKKELKENLEIFIFFLFSIISSLLVIKINRKIFTSFEEITSTWVLKSILIVYSCSIGISSIFYILYSIPEKQENRKKLKSLKKYSEEINNRKEDNNVDKKINQYKNEFEIKEDNNADKKISQDGSVFEIKEDNNDIIAFSCCGYVFFQKKIEKNNTCICYKYDSYCSWLSLKLSKPEIFAPLITEFLLQFSSVGFNNILSERLENAYSYEENINYFYYFMIVVAYIMIYLIFFKSLNILNNQENVNKCRKLCSYLAITFLALFCYFVSNLGCSIIYIYDDKKTEEEWDQIIKPQILSFKSLDLHMLTFYDFFNDEDCLNTGFIIKAQNFIWMVIEIFFDIFEVKIRTLIIIQSVSSGLSSIFLIFAMICSLMDTVCN